MARLLPVVLAGAALLAAATPRAYADATPAHADLRLIEAPCDDAGGADLRCYRDDPLPPRRPGARSYFQQHADMVMRDMLMFHVPYTLENMRDRDMLYLYGPTPGTFSSATKGVAMFSGAVLGVAHLPGKARVLFADPRAHIGPALFDNGGMGAGVGGRL